MFVANLIVMLFTKTPEMTSQEAGFSKKFSLHYHLQYPLELSDNMQMCLTAAKQLMPLLTVFNFIISNLNV